MKLRSGSLPRITFDEEASSCVIPLATPPTKRGRSQNLCVYVDDEAEVEEDSNILNDAIEATRTNVEEQEDIPRVESDSQEESSSGDDEDSQRSKHKRQFGKKIPLGLMKDVLGQFYVKRQSPPPLVPFCCLVPHEAVRFALDLASWLVSAFDTTTYVETMGVFLVSLVGPSDILFFPRWFMHCKEDKILSSIPSVTKEWIDLKDENTMYSPTLQDLAITNWEASMYPWWIDYPIGVIPKQEKELRARFMIEHGIDGISDTHADDTLEPSNNIDITDVVQDKKAWGGGGGLGG
ncbi:hypothetical protein L7F22_041459 [Adiantum nelumboides]|nr:hypothetical protein [Adiantum nelumboides]